MPDYTATPNYSFQMPSDHVNTNTWGGYNNGNWSSVDGLIYTNAQGITSINAQLNSSTLSLANNATNLRPTQFHQCAHQLYPTLGFVRG